MFRQTREALLFAYTADVIGDTLFACTSIVEKVPQSFAYMRTDARAYHGISSDQS